MTARPTAPADYRRYAACHICSVTAGQPCRNLLPRLAGQPMSRPHPERPVAVDRDGHGVMILGRREHVTSSRPGTTHGAYAHHAAFHAMAVCSGVLLAEDTFFPLPQLSNGERCQRPACRRLWRNEEYQ